MSGKFLGVLVSECLGGDHFLLGMIRIDGESHVNTEGRIAPREIGLWKPNIRTAAIAFAGLVFFVGVGAALAHVTDGMQQADSVLNTASANLDDSSGIGALKADYESLLSHSGIVLRAFFDVGQNSAELTHSPQSVGDDQQEDDSQAVVRFVPDNLFGVSVIQSGYGWAAGYYGTLLKTTDDGGKWTKYQLPVNDLIRRIRFLDDRIGWAVSHRGRILFTQDGGSDWIVQHEVPGIYLRDIVMVDRENGWSVGNSKTILHTTDGGKTWSPQTFAHWTQDLPNLNGVAAFDAMNAIVVGEFGVIIRTTDGGVTWTRVQGSLQKTYTAVAVAGDHAIAVGLDGALAYIPREGDAKPLPAPLPRHLFDIALDQEGNGFIVGAGCAFRISGEFLTPIKIDVPKGADLTWLGGVSLSPDGRAIAVGSRGLVVAYDLHTNTFEKMADWTK